MTIVAGLLYLAEVALPGTSRWIAIGLALIIAARMKPYEPTVPRRFQLGAICVGLTIGITAVLYNSPGLGVCALLLLSPQVKHRQTAALALVTLGVHFFAWRYLSSFPLRGLPTIVASTISWLVNPIAHITPTSLFVAGHTISWSSVPLLTAIAPILAATLWADSGFRGFAAGAATAGSAMLVLVVTLTMAGHTHFEEAWWWPTLAVAIGVSTSLWTSPLTSRAEPRWDILFVSATLALGVWDLGVNPNHSRLRIVFDEGHGKWETVDAKSDQASYGRDTTYNYAQLSTWLKAKHEVSTVISDWSQIKGDVLVVKMPTVYFGQSEKAAIDRFVRAGGLLIVIGDHTNLYGTTLVINDLLDPYGLGLNADATVPLDGEHYDLRAAWWLRTRYLRGIEDVQFQTAATIYATSPLVVPTIVGDRAVGEDADYSNDRFFGLLHPGVEDRQAPLVIAAERNWGAGRILLFADSTIFSSFSVMAPGNGELFQNFLEQGTLHRGRWRVVLACTCLLIAMVAARRDRLAFVFCWAAVAIAISSLSARPDSVLDDYSLLRVDFDRSHSQLELRADTRNAHGADFSDYSTFFAWVGRLGLIPHVARAPYLDPKVPTIILNPTRTFTTEESERIERYVRLGGRLLVMDDERYASQSTSAPLLARLGITLQQTIGMGSLFEAGPPALSSDVFGLPFDLLGLTPRHLGASRASGIKTKPIVGGALPVLVDDDGSVVAAEASLGQGKVMVFLHSSTFADFIMGDVWGGAEPSPEQRRLYQLEYDLITRLALRDNR